MVTSPPSVALRWLIFSSTRSVAHTYILVAEEAHDLVVALGRQQAECGRHGHDDEAAVGVGVVRKGDMRCGKVEQKASICT